VKLRRLVSIAIVVACFGVGVRANEPTDQALLQRGLALGNAGRLDDAEAVLLEGKRRFPTDNRFLLELAGIAYRRDDFGTAKAYLRAALALNPSDRYGNDFLGTLYLLEGNLPATLKYWNRLEKPLLAGVNFAPPPLLAPLLLERTFDVSAGQVLTSKRLERTEANLDMAGIFADCRYDLAPRTDDRFDLTIRPTPISSPLQGWPGYLISALRGLPYQEIHADFYNVARRAINLESFWRWDAQKRRIALEFSGPLHFWRYRLLFDARQENWNLTGTYFGAGSLFPSLRKVESGADLQRSLTPRLKWTVGTRLAFREYASAGGGPFFAKGWSSEILNRFDAHIWDWPEHRVRVDGWGMLRTGRILTGSPSRLIAPEAALQARWIPQAKGDVYSLIASVRSGAVFGNVPLDELFILGMERDNDLWLRGVVGTRGGQKGSAPMGRRYLLTRTELDRKMWQLPMVRCTLGPFFDSGTIADPSREFGSNGYLYATGLEAKIGTVGGLQLLAVYGRNLRDGSGVFYTAVRR
jgi:tetratricopeptide (TPR) repeat protein